MCLLFGALFPRRYYVWDQSRAFRERDEILAEDRNLRNEAFTAASTMQAQQNAALIPVNIGLDFRFSRRRIDPHSGRALEILGHSIDYLIDQYIQDGETFTTNSGPMQAVQLLMGLNRQIYYQCPEVPTFIERCLAITRIFRI